MSAGRDAAHSSAGSRRTADAEFPVQCAVADAGEPRGYGDFLKKSQRGVVVRLSMHAWVGVLPERIGFGEGGQRVGLCFFCQTEVVGKMDDAGGICLMKSDVA